MIDYGAAWVELAAWIAAEPNRGRQATLIKMAELAEKYRIPDEQLAAFVASLPQLPGRFGSDPQDPEVVAGSAPERSVADRQSIAA